MNFQLNFVCAALAMMAGTAQAVTLTDIPANPKAAGMVAPNIVSPELDLRLLATGSMLLDGAADVDPSGLIKYYGYHNDGPMVPVIGAMATPTTPLTEAHKSDPDKNVYLVMPGQHGADPTYDYGTHFIYQGHETGLRGVLTRVNLDADLAHRVTLLSQQDENGNAMPTFDGITWYPWSGKLLLTAEFGGAGTGGVFQADPDFSASSTSTTKSLQGIIGKGAYEGIQADSAGNLWIVEDIGGPSGTINNKAKQPNSFVYRFVPTDKTDLTLGGKLQALQVKNLAKSANIVFHAGAADADILSQDMADLHTYGNVFDTQWVTIHDTAVDGTTAYDANAAAKAAGATPFKRPENGVFRPMTTNKFTQFFFTETGDTNNLTQAGETYGGFGAVFKLTQTSPSSNTGKLTMKIRGDQAHSGFDNLTFLNMNQLMVTEDAGDTLHTQRNALDSGYVYDVTADYSNVANQPVRFLAEGRDPSATIDATASGTGNDGDNEISGIHVSNGDPTIAGILGAKVPTPFQYGWRVFWTQMHGDNNLWEIKKIK